MPSPETILSSAAAIANRWWTLAIGWHVFFGAAIVGLLAGWRPSKQFAGHLMAAPLLSVSALAWASGNPFNGPVFAALTVSLIVVASRFPKQPVEIGSSRQLVPGALFLAFGWTYPHFLNASHWTAYTYAAPLGLLPCPTLSVVIGVTLMVNGLRSRPWSMTLAVAGFLYGAIGVFTLGVPLDYGLLAAATVLGAVAAASTWRFVRANRRERIRRLPGDDLIPDSLATLTHAITIQRPPRDVWPWLAQMGAGVVADGTAMTFLTTAAARVPTASCRICNVLRSG